MEKTRPKQILYIFSLNTFYCR